MWDYPTEPTLSNVTSSLSKVLTTSPISNFLTSAIPVMGLAVSGQSRIDVTAWTFDSLLLVSIVNLEYVDSNANISITLQRAVSGINEIAWGAGDWITAENMIWKVGIKGLEVDLVVYDLS